MGCSVVSGDSVTRAAEAAAVSGDGAVSGSGGVEEGALAKSARSVADATLASSLTNSARGGGGV